MHNVTMATQTAKSRRLSIISCLICRLLQSASGHFSLSDSSFSSSVTRLPGQELQHKRLCYVRYCVKHLFSCASKHRLFLVDNQDRLCAALIEHFHTTERVVVMQSKTKITGNQTLKSSRFILRQFRFSC